MLPAKSAWRANGGEPCVCPRFFEEFCDYLRVEKEAAPKTVTTYRSRFEDFMEFARLEAQQPSPCPIPEPGRRT
jgi:hypothetical protein